MPNTAGLRGRTEREAIPLRSQFSTTVDWSCVGIILLLPYGIHQSVALPFLAPFLLLLFALWQLHHHPLPSFLCRPSSTPLHPHPDHHLSCLQDQNNH